MAQLFSLGVMRALILITLFFLSLVLFVACSQRRAVTQASTIVEPFQPLISPQSAAYSNVVTAADRLVLGAGLKWGEPSEVRWQPDPLNRYVVIYGTPQSELGYAGYRAVHVATNGEAWFVPRE